MHFFLVRCSITQIIISYKLMYPLGVGGPQREIVVACQINQRNASQQHRSRGRRVVLVTPQMIVKICPLGTDGGMNENILLRYPRAAYSGVSRTKIAR